LKKELIKFTESIDDFGLYKPSSQIDMFAFFFVNVLNLESFNIQEIKEAFSTLRLVPYSNIGQYLKDNSDRSRIKSKKIKFFFTSGGYHLEGNFEKEIKEKINYSEDTSFLEFRIDQNSLSWKPNDIPFLNRTILKNAHFFTKLYFLFYHLENSIRKFLTNRLSSVLGNNWQAEILSDVDLSKAQSIRSEVNLSQMLPERGDSILFYCMWNDYAKIMKQYPAIFRNDSEANEIIAHLNTLTKIRNAIAHNVATIPQDYQKELTVFLNKYIRLFESN